MRRDAQTQNGPGPVGSSQPRSRVRRRRGYLVVMFGVLAAALFSLTSVSFLAGSDSLTLSIAPRPAQSSGGSTLAAGQSLRVIANQAAAVTIHAGKANQDEGLLLYTFEVQPDLSDKLRVTFMWLDSPNANGALKSGYMDVALFYFVGAGTSCGADEFSVKGYNETTGAANQDICVARAAPSTSAFARALLTEAKAGVMLQSTTPNKHFIYLLASVTNNGGNLAPGQQGQLGTLKFWAEAFTTSS